VALQEHQGRIGMRVSQRKSRVGVLVLAGSLGLVLAGAVPGSAAAARTTGRPLAPEVRLHNIAVGKNAFQVAIDPGTRSAWVAAGHLARVSEVTQRVTARILAGANVQLVAVDPKAKVVWAADCALGCTLLEVSEANNRVTHTIAGLPALSGIAVDPARHLVWMAAGHQASAPNVLAVSEVSRTVVRKLRLHVGADHQLGAITIDTRSGTAWASVVPSGPATTRCSVAEIRESTGRIVRGYARNHVGMPGASSVVTAIDPRRGIAWLAFGAPRAPSGTVEIVSIARHAVIRTFRGITLAPPGLAIDPRIRTAIATLGRYPNVRSPDNVAVVSESSGKVQRVIPMGYYPNQLAVDPRSGNVYVPIVFKGIVTEFRL